MYEYEDDLLGQGFLNIAGCDEAGRGPLAGPLFAAAVILNPDDHILGLNDSKQLSAKKRESLYQEIISRAKAYSIVQIDELTIDSINIYQASKKAMLDAIQQLSIQPDFVLTDAMPLGHQDYPHLAIIKGDALSATIAAASILAKVSRDAYMIQLDKQYPEYGFAKHKGYPTKEHLAALKKHGITPYHRRTYEPVKSMMREQMTLDL